jgi:hypothetical protein
MSDIDTIQGEATEVVFALTPGRLKSDQIIDFSTTAGRKLYKSATEPLMSLHDLSAENLRDFIVLLEQRTKIYDWNDILEIPDEKNETFIPLLKQYGTVLLEDVREHAKTYVNKECRAAQESQQLADCILNSLTVEARNSVTLCEDEYTIKGTISGTCLLKVVIRESHIDTNATTRIIREELTKLDTYIVSIDSDIIKFNEHVKDLLNKLKSRGATTHDLLANLFKAYKAVSDKQFVKYIDSKKNDYDEGKDITSNQLMLLAANRYKTMKQDQEWNAPSQEQEQIIALQAEVKRLKVSKANKSEHNKESETETKTFTRTSKGNKGKKGNRKRKPKWMLIPPKQGESHKRKMNGKTYSWCPKHEAWGIHLPSDCEGKGYVPGKRKETPKEEESQTSAPPTKKVKIAEALSSILMNDES